MNSDWYFTNSVCSFPELTLNNLIVHLLNGRLHQVSKWINRKPFEIFRFGFGFLDASELLEYTGVEADCKVMIGVYFGGWWRGVMAVGFQGWEHQDLEMRIGCLEIVVLYFG